MYVLEEAGNLTDAALDTVYFIFEGYAVERETWTQLLLDMVKLQDRPNWLSETHPDADFTAEAETLGFYVSEFTDVLKESDERFPRLTVEKRQIIRDLHMTLVGISDKIDTLR